MLTKTHEGVTAHRRDPFSHLVAGVRYEAEQRNSGRGLEVVELAFEARGTALVPV